VSLFCDPVIDEIDRARDAAAARDRQFEVEMANAEDSARRKQREIDVFLETCRAVSCPVEAYAFWLFTWLSQGGRITHSYNYPMSRNDWLMPTRSSGELLIPTAYGAQALHLVVFSEFTSIPTAASSNDQREGCEYGHGRVLRYDGGRATTNNAVASYPDVEECIRLQKLSAMKRVVHDCMNAQ
jgi:hypothetical protein